MTDERPTAGQSWYDMRVEEQQEEQAALRRQRAADAVLRGSNKRTPNAMTSLRTTSYLKATTHLQPSKPPMKLLSREMRAALTYRPKQRNPLRHARRAWGRSGSERWPPAPFLSDWARKLSSEFANWSRSNYLVIGV